MRTLVTCAPRSGSLSLSTMLMNSGVDMPHEKMGRHGTVSCYYSVRSPKYIPYASKKYQPHEGEPLRRRNYFQRHVILFRHPLKTVASMVPIVNPAHQEWMAAHKLGSLDVKPKLLRMLHVWVNTYTRLLEENVDWKVIETPLSGVAVYKVFGVSMKTADIPHRNKTHGYMKAKVIEWRDLNVLDNELASMARILYRQLKEKAK